jgi:hypothetical protein
MDASHFDANTAYAAVNRIRCDDMHPHIYRTRDGGKTWKEIINGLPDNPVNSVKEDPKRKGLLFAGSETAVYVSFDDGDHWQSLRLNMPATSIRDLVIKDNDIVVGTHGRGFWILDDITALRQVTSIIASDNAFLYQPGTVIRVRWSMYTDTPLPQEEPAGQNPPDGAVIDYYLKEKAVGEITLDIVDAKGKTIRHFSSNDKPYDIPPVNIPLYWIRPQQILSADAGSHRFLWDLHYAPLDLPPSYPISAIYKNTAPDPTSPWVMPGIYSTKLTVNGKTYQQPLIVKMDPRVKTSLADLQIQHDLSVRCYEYRKQTMAFLQETGKLHEQVRTLLPKASGLVADQLKDMDNKVAELENATQQPGFNRINNTLGALLNTLHETEMPPTLQATNAVAETGNRMRSLAEKWMAIKTADLPTMNVQLKKLGLGLITM